jgi:hypothetical protein
MEYEVMQCSALNRDGQRCVDVKYFALLGKM